MKKIIAAVGLVILLASNAIAEGAFGIRGSIGASFMSLDSKYESNMGDYYSSLLSTATGVSPASWTMGSEAAFMGGFGLFGNFSIPTCPELGVQCELNFLFNKGSFTVESKVSGAALEGNYEGSYTTMELPLLLTYTVNKGGFFEFVPQLGGYLSIPIGKCEEEVDARLKVNGVTSTNSKETQKERITSSVIFGAAVGADFALNLSETSALLLNVRYMHDFNKLELSDVAVARRSVLLFSAGYRYTIK